MKPEAIPCQTSCKYTNVVTGVLELYTVIAEIFRTRKNFVLRGQCHIHWSTRCEWLSYAAKFRTFSQKNEIYEIESRSKISAIYSKCVVLACTTEQSGFFAEISFHHFHESLLLTVLNAVKSCIKAAAYV